MIVYNEKHFDATGQLKQTQMSSMQPRIELLRT